MMQPADRPLFRQDLLAEQVDEQGTKYIDVGDPDSGQVFRFYEAELAIACGMDGQRDIAGLVRWAADELGLKTTPAEIKNLIGTLGSHGFLEHGRDVVHGHARPAADPDLAPGVVVAAASKPAAGIELEMGPAGTSTKPADKSGPKAPQLELGSPGAATATKSAKSAVEDVSLGAPGKSTAEPSTPVSTDISLDLSDQVAIGRNEVKEAIRQSRVMAAVEVPAELQDALDEKVPPKSATAAADTKAAEAKAAEAKAAEAKAAEAKAAEAKATEAKAAEAKAAEAKAAEKKAADAKAAEAKAAEAKAAEAKAAEKKAADAKAAEAKAGDKKGADKKGADKKGADKKGADKQANAKAADAKSKQPEPAADAKAGDKQADAKAGDKQADAKAGDKQAGAKAGDKQAAAAKAGDKSTQKTAEKQPVKPEAPKKGVSPFLILLLLLILGGGGIALWKFVLNKSPDAQQTGGVVPTPPAAPVAAVPPGSAGAVAEPNPLEAPVTPTAPTAKFINETPPERQIMSIHNGRLEWVDQAGKDVTSGTVVAKLVGAKSLEAEIKNLQAQMDRVKRELEVATKDRDNAQAAGNAAGAAAAERKVKDRQASLDKKSEDVEKKKEELERFRIYAFNDGKLTAVSKVGTVIGDTTEVARIQPVNRITATFPLETLMEKGIAVVVYVTEGNKEPITCKVLESRETEVKVGECQGDKIVDGQLARLHLSE